MNKETKRINSAKDLRVYRKAYALAMEIFNISKQWPSEIGSRMSEVRCQKSAVIAVCMCEFERSLGKKKVSSSFCQQVDRFRWRKQ